MKTLTWTETKRSANQVYYEGRHEGTVYAILHQFGVSKITGYQFRGLQGFELGAKEFKVAQNLEQAKNICQVMMSAWDHARVDH